MGAPSDQCLESHGYLHGFDSCGVHQPLGNPCALCSEHCAVSVRSDCIFNDPAPMNQPREPQPCRETQRTEIRGLPDETVRV